MAQKLIKPKRRSYGMLLSGKGLSAKVALVESGVSSVEIPEFKGGDTIRVSFRIKEGEKERIQAFEGTVIRLKNQGSNRSAVVRKVSHGVGVERIFTLRSPRVAKIEVIQPGRARRAKMYYLRALKGKAARVDREAETAGSARPSSPSST